MALKKKHPGKFDATGRVKLMHKDFSLAQMMHGRVILVQNEPKEEKIGKWKEKCSKKKANVNEQLIFSPLSWIKRIR